MMRPTRRLTIVLKGRGPLLRGLLGAFTLAAAVWGCASPSGGAPAEEATPRSETAPTAQVPAPPPETTRLHKGLDVSGHSGTVDWSRLVADGHSFAFVKATEGMDLKDPAFDEHWAGAKAAGLFRGAYHFYVTEDDPEAQARFFTSVVQLEPGDLAPVVDIELMGHGTPPGLPDRFKKFLDLIEGHYGVKPIIYTAPNFWDQHLTDQFGAYPLWVAEYGVEAPRLPRGWQAWHLWQFQGDASVPGVEKSVDLSHVNREGPDLSVLIFPASAATD